MTKKDWNAEFKKLIATKGSDKLRMELTPFRDWRVVVIVFLTALSGSIGFNIYISSEANRDAFFSAAPKSSGVTKFNEEGLKKVIKEIDDKYAQFEKTKTDQILLVDPSL